MAVEFREKGPGWQAHVLGEVLLPAPQALLALRGTGELSGVVFAEIPLKLERGETFEHSFDLPVLASSWPVRLEFEYDASPRYYLYDGFDITLPMHGQSPVAAPILAYEGGGDGGPDTLPQLGIELPTDPPGGSLDATTTVQGTVQFKSPGGSTFKCRSCKVDIYDRDTGAEQLLGSIDADSGGYFSKIVDNTDGAGGVDVFVKVYTSTAMGRVIDANGNAWMNSTPDLAVNCPDGGICNLGTFTLQTTGNKSKAFWIYRAVMTGWNEIRWNGPGEDIGQATVRFPIDNYAAQWFETHDSSTMHFHTAGDPLLPNEIHIGSMQHGADAAAHEHGHYAMSRAYNWGGGNYWPPVNYTVTPLFDNESNRTDAWVEGWANYFAIEVWDDPIFNWTACCSWINLESWTCSWGCASPTGDDVVGRVAATLWDIVDTPNDGYDSNIDRSVTETWNTLRYARSTNFNGYYNNWLNRGYTQSDFLNCADWNTILY